MKTRGQSHAYGPWTSEGASPPALNEPLLLSGYGGVIRTAGFSAVRVQVRLSAFRDKERWDDERVPILERLDASRTWWRPLSIGWLPYVRLGQVYLNGHVVGDAGGHVEEFDLEISDGTAGSVYDFQRLGRGARAPVPLVPPELQSRPPAPHWLSWRGGRPGSRYFRIRIPDRMQEWVMIPCTEIARYYYMPSSEFAASVAGKFYDSEDTYERGDGSFPRHLSEIYNPELSHPRMVDGKVLPGVWLRSRIKDEDAVHAARFCYDPVARARALRIGAVLQQFEDAGQVPLFDAAPPFSGPTRLRVYGFWTEAELDGAVARHFIALSIRRCTGEFPVGQFVFGRDNDGRTSPGEAVVDGGGEDERVKRPGPVRPRKGVNETIYPDPAPEWMRGLVKIESDDRRFAPPKKLSARKLPKEPSDERTEWPAPVPIPGGDGVNPDPPEGGKSPRERGSVVQGPASLDANPPGLSPRLDLFREAMEAVADRPRTLAWRVPVKVETVDGDVLMPRHPNSSVFPLSDVRRRRPAWCYMHRDPKSPADDEYRHCMIAEVEMEGRFAYAIEAEARPNESIPVLVMAKSSGQRLGNHLLVRLLRRCVENGRTGRGIWGENWAEVDGVYARVHHLPGSGSLSGEMTREEYVGALVERLKGGIVLALRQHDPGGR